MDAMAMGLEAVPSEAPEVVPDELDKQIVLDRPGGGRRSPPRLFTSTSSTYADPSRDTPTLPVASPTKPPKVEVQEVQKQKIPWKARSFGLVTTILVAVLAFLIGGAIGGGIGGGVGSHKASSCSNTEISTGTGTGTGTGAGAGTSTGTVTAPGSRATQVVDAAGCPLSNGTIYESKPSNEQFLTLCGTEVMPVGGAYIELDNSIQDSFDACLDSCAAYNEEVSRTECVAATWVVFSPSNAGRNMRCYLKNDTGTASPSTESKQTLVSGYLQTS